MRVTLTADSGQSVSAMGEVIVEPEPEPVPPIPGSLPAGSPDELDGMRLWVLTGPSPLTVSHAKTAKVNTHIEVQGNALPRGPYAAVIDWGDGTPRMDVTINLIEWGGLTWFDLPGEHIYRDPGRYTYRVTLRSAGGFTATGAGTITVLPPGSTPGVNVHGATSLPLTTTSERAVVDQALAQFTVDVRHVDVVEYSATVDWGDSYPSGVEKPHLVSLPMPSG